MDCTDRGSLRKSNFGEKSDAMIRFVGHNDNVTANMATEANATHYNMAHKRGRALIFNHETFRVSEENLPTRKGTNVDAKSMERSLKKLNFDVLMHQDLTYDALMQLVADEARYDHTDYDCFVMVVLSHGDVDSVDGISAKNRIDNANTKQYSPFCKTTIDMLYANDKPYMVEELFTPFAAHLCTTLAGKPKLFFVQACRNIKIMQQDTSKEEPCINTNYGIPFQADFLFAYSSIPGYYSWRNTFHGSAFIEALCKELNKHAYKQDIATILTLVNQRVAIDYESNTPDDVKRHQRKQSPCFNSKLTRSVQFNRKWNILTSLCRFFRNDVACKSTDANATIYNMNHKYRGIALVFNHENFAVPGKNLHPRTGTEKDVNSIRATLKNLNFDVTVYLDLDCDTLMQHVANAATFDHTDYDCFVIVVLSHGDVDILYAHDKAYKVKELSKPFMADSCTTLAGKPKLFFIQACRGEKFMRPVTLSRTEADGTKINYKIPSHSDFLLAYSNIPGYYLWQNKSVRGSSFIKALCTELDKNASEHDIVKILTSVNRRVANDYAKYAPLDAERHPQKQFSFFKSNLTHLLQFYQKQNKLDNNQKLKSKKIC